MSDPSNQELSAKRKFPCPACGAEAEWNPAKQMLACPFCGTQSPAPVKSDGSVVHEEDLAAALQAVPAAEMGWNAEKKTVRCQSCNAISVFDAARVAQRCDFCGSPALIEADDIKAPIRPGALLAFKIPDSKVREDIRRWYGSRWFAPNKLGSKALTDTLRGLYVPYWTFDAHAVAQWDAEAGYHYTETDSEGRSEQRTRWEHVSGTVEHFFDDQLIPASRGIKPKLLEKSGPFPTTTDLVPYDPGYLSGWVVEQYQVDLHTAAEDCRGRMEAALRQMCSSEVPGDTQRNLRVNAEYSGQTFKHVLLPIWLLTYNYGTRNYQVAVNGYTGKIAGDYPLSWVKIAIATIIGLIILFIILSTQGHR